MRRGAGGRRKAGGVGGRPMAQLKNDTKHEHGRASLGAGRRENEAVTPQTGRMMGTFFLK
jgi:hypothetical protein